MSTFAGATPNLCELTDDGECVLGATSCTCTIQGGCGEGESAGCCFCAHMDIYLPCPLFGSCYGYDGCQNVGEDCCTPEQIAAAKVSPVYSEALWAARREATEAQR